MLHVILFFIDIGSVATSLPFFKWRVIKLFKLFSYSRGRYVTASEYSNTAYIQFTESTPGFTPIKVKSDQRVLSAAASDSKGEKVLVNIADYPAGSTTGTPHIGIYSTETGEFKQINELEGYTVRAAGTFSSGSFAASISDSSYRSRIVLIDPENGKVTEIPGTDNIEASTVNFFECGDGIGFRTSGGNDIKKIMPDGSLSGFADSEKRPDSGICGMIGNKLGISTYYISEDRFGIEFYDFDSKSSVKADYTPERSEVCRIFSVDSKTAGVLLVSKEVLFFDVETGSQTGRVKLSGLSQEPISAVGTGDGKFAVLCRDSKLYEADSSGLTGRTITLELTEDYLGTGITEAEQKNSDFLSVKPSSDSGSLYIIWNGSQSWLINKEQFKVRYRIGDFGCAPTENARVFVCDSFNGKAGYFPIYDAKQLVDAASEYLRALGE